MRESACLIPMRKKLWELVPSAWSPATPRITLISGTLQSNTSRTTLSRPPPAEMGRSSCPERRWWLGFSGRACYDEQVSHCVDCPLRCPTRFNQILAFVWLSWKYSETVWRLASQLSQEVGSWSLKSLAGAALSDSRARTSPFVPLRVQTAVRHTFSVSALPPALRPLRPYLSRRLRLLHRRVALASPANQDSWTLQTRDGHRRRFHASLTRDDTGVVDFPVPRGFRSR